MRRQARRLWLGDWEQGEDTVVITPENVEDAPVADRRLKLVRAITGGAALALLFALGLLLFSNGGEKRAAQQSPVTAAQQPQPLLPQAQPPQGAPPQGFGGADLTGAGANKAAQAAVARYPGGVERVTRGPAGGGYVVHVIQADGNEVHVLVDEQFKVQGSDANSGPSGLGTGPSQ